MHHARQGVAVVHPFAICGVLYGIARLWAKYVKRESMYGFHFGFMVNSKELAWQYLLRCFKASVPFPGIVYNNMCQACFNIFSCQPLRNGLTVMAAAPAIVCWESARHKSLIVVAVIALIVYVVGTSCASPLVMSYAGAALVAVAACLSPPVLSGSENWVHLEGPTGIAAATALGTHSHCRRAGIHTRHRRVGAPQG